MSWDLTFISEQDFTKHVQLTIQQYGDKLAPYCVRQVKMLAKGPQKG